MHGISTTPSSPRAWTICSERLHDRERRDARPDRPRPPLPARTRRSAVAVPVHPHLLVVRGRGPRGPRRVARVLVGRSPPLPLPPVRRARLRPRPPFGALTH